MEPPSALQEKLVAIERVEDVAEVVPGRRYEVRCVRATHIAPWFGRWVPILGELHEDREIIKVATEHWHVDWRFVSAALLRDAEDYAAGFAGPKGAIIGLIVSKRALRKPKEEQWRNVCGCMKSGRRRHRGRRRWSFTIGKLERSAEFVRIAG
jgi:hypothetical protein